MWDSQDLAGSMPRRPRTLQACLGRCQGMLRTLRSMPRRPRTLPSMSRSCQASLHILGSHNIYIYMTYKFEFFQLYKKNAHKYKIIQSLSSSNFIYSVRYMIIFFMIYLYWTFAFDTKIKKFLLDGTYLYIQTLIEFQFEI